MAGSNYKLKFKGEIKAVGAKKSASLDMVYRLTLDTEDKHLLELGALPTDILVDVTVEAKA